ncbi:MAG TPA: GntR family transcriptional regulator [Conexibacter sp.]|nr:GntR family transcriptional regulator [Conexibacter sp.]
MTRRPSLVDGAEQVLREWIAPGRQRSGNRLPPEHELAAMLGVSRGTLRTALERLEATGEIVRRQGSGTFVGRLARPPAFSEGLERLTPYSQLARRHGVRLAHRDVAIEQRELGAELGALFGVAPETHAVAISRVVLADGKPMGTMLDIVHPDIALPPTARLRRTLERGAMVLDVLLAEGVPVAFANTRIDATLVGADDTRGAALGVRRPTAMLELEETVHVRTGAAVQRSTDLFAPGGLDLRVMRQLELERPEPVSGRTA